VGDLNVMMRGQFISTTCHRFIEPNMKLSILVVMSVENESRKQHWDWNQCKRSRSGSGAEKWGLSLIGNRFELQPLLQDLGVLQRAVAGWPPLK
jgi:hypothetical protein